MSLDAYCQARSESYCEVYVPCCTQAGMTLTKEQCVAANNRACMNEAARASEAGAHYDPEAAAACADIDVTPLFDACHVPQLNSKAYVRKMEPCAAVQASPLQAGATCQDDLQCGAAPGFVGYCNENECQVAEVLPIGGDCLMAFAECAPGSFCSSYDGICTAVLSDGASCSRNTQCASGTCKGGNDTCVSASCPPAMCVSAEIDAKFCRFFVE